jgi:ABC-2 type transport system ATP-binding protein
MDEAERCHRLAYISYGRLLAAGTADEVIARAGLTTWEVRGASLGELQALLAGDPGWMIVPFGSALRASSAQGRDLARLAADRGGTALQVEPVKTNLEDVFISLTRDARDNFG